ncbi:uncharacterized protein LOC123510453 [Portunus trituberculatus]|uniref:uncharacterized protein LOC123510453 n=1 Tax=Portunus trituberculatus TaxID=210409 RepID=UPI001E1CB555|nr:uncharacterized protein LOC123510453 [Portunus trituberculatus]
MWFVYTAVAHQLILTPSPLPRWGITGATTGKRPHTVPGKNLLTRLTAPQGIGLFEVPMSRVTSNTTWHHAFFHTISQALKVRQTSWNVFILVTSDDPTFLMAFAKWSVRARLLVWSTRLLVYTNNHLQGMQELHKILSLTNSILLLSENTTQMERVQMFSVVPYSNPQRRPLLVASWAPQRGLVLESTHTLFPEKFEKFNSLVEASVTMTEDATHEAVMEEDPKKVGHQRLVFKGYMVTVLDFIAQGQNFSYTFRKSPDGTYGVKGKDGTWTGMVGQVYREEADLGLGPFTLTEERAGSVDYTWPVKVSQLRYWLVRGN